MQLRFFIPRNITLPLIQPMKRTTPEHHQNTPSCERKSSKTVQALYLGLRNISCPVWLLNDADSHTEWLTTNDTPYCMHKYTTAAITHVPSVRHQKL